MRTETPKAIYLKDYTPPSFKVTHIDLTFRIYEDRTLVTASTQFVRNAPGPLHLNGEHVKLVSVSLDGRLVSPRCDDKSLILDDAPDRFTLTVETEIDPAANTRLEGLYKSQGTWCTQCEAEGFRTITYYPDRPDVMATFTTRIEADKTTCPVLLSNGNLMEEGALDGGRHFAVWNDPFPKPCYLFALVAGDLVHIEDTFRTAKGRDVALRIYVRAGDETQCDHAMESLKLSMKWDEDVYGRIYDYDRFNIVAVSDFNMGAMENTSLNIFNTALVLAHPETATDLDFERVESVIAHEYFHNWTGNRVTCRDWFQLSLKEGLTVFRDQEFSADMNSRGVARIDDVTALRRMQFSEDAGPMAHPVRPDNYIEINNFYTMTVYEKGAEVIRMQHTLLGPENYRKATDLYFDRFDGQAVTCDDFVQCMSDASGLDLTQFKLWYSQAGTPVVRAEGHYDERAQTYTLTLSQTVPPTPGQPVKQPMHIPVRVGLVGPNGHDMAERLLELREAKQSFVFDHVTARPVPSILRGFSAPVRLQTTLSDDDLRFLMLHDSDGFNRWESGQALALRVMGRMMDQGLASIDSAFLDSYGLMVEKALTDSDHALMARMLTLPDLQVMAQDRDIVDPDALHATRMAVLDVILAMHGDTIREIYESCNDAGPFSASGEARARRALKNTALRLLRDTALAKEQYDGATNMTDRVAALSVLADTVSPERDDAFADFYNRFRSYMLVVDKWFALQAGAVRATTNQDVRGLRDHADFILTNPNRVRSLYAAFAMNNPVCFHDRSGEGYDFLGDAIIQLNSKNPQIASRLLTPLREWRRYTPDRQEKMRAVLNRILAEKNLSPDVFEVVSKTLAA